MPHIQLKTNLEIKKPATGYMTLKTLVLAVRRLKGNIAEGRDQYIADIVKYLDQCGGINRGLKIDLERNYLRIMADSYTSRSLFIFSLHRDYGIDHTSHKIEAVHLINPNTGDVDFFFTWQMADAFAKFLADNLVLKDVTRHEYATIKKAVLRKQYSWALDFYSNCLK